jgi:hypothetical protein
VAPSASASSGGGVHEAGLAGEVGREGGRALEDLAVQVHLTAAAAARRQAICTHTHTYRDG